MNKIAPPTGPRLSEAQKKEMRAFNAEDVKRARAFREMMQTEGWGLFRSLLDAWVNERMNSLIGPTPSGGELVAEHAKGTVYGLIMARDQVPAIVAQFEQFESDTNSGSDKEKGKGK